MEINNVNVVSTQNVKPTSKEKKVVDSGLKQDSFEKQESFNPAEADTFLSELKDSSGAKKFRYESYKKDIIENVSKEPEKWKYIKQIAPRENFSPFYLSEFSERDLDELKKITELGIVDDKKGEPKFLARHINEIVRSGETVFNNVKILSKTDLSSENLVKAAKEKGLDCQKVANKVNEMSKLVGDDLKEISFARDAFSKGDYTLRATKNDKSEIKEILDNNLNRYALETLDSYKTAKSSYKIKKAVDYRNNTTSKVRFTIDETGYPRATHEVRILKDKNGKIKKTEYIEPSDIKGVMSIKYRYPNGKEEIISSGTVDKKTGITSIKKNMVSSLGTRTEYLFEDDPQGNRISDYKITDKNGNVLLQNSESFEVISDNKFISSKNNEKYEITTDDKTVKVKDLNNPKRTATFERGRQIFGEQDEIIKVLKKMPGEELFKLSENVNSLQGTKDVLKSYSQTGIDSRMIYTGDDLFVILHELGHAVDMKDVNMKNLYSTEQNAIFNDKKFNEIYDKEKAAFNKQFPDAQRNHIAYFINHETHYNGEIGGRKETIAESNALLTTAKSHEVLAMRSQYLQQHFPETIAYLDKKLNEGKKI